MWESFLQTLAGAGVAGALVVFLVRSLAKHWLQKDIDRYRIELQAASERELAALRGELERRAVEHQVRFSTLHEKQAEIIAEVFGHLERIHQAFRRWMSPIHVGDVDMHNRRDEAAEAYMAAVQYYYPRAIWLDRDTCNQINELLENFWDGFVDFAYDLDESGIPKDKRKWKAGWEKVKDDIPKARGRLDEKFREALGVAEAAVKERKHGGEGPGQLTSDNNRLAPTRPAAAPE